MTDYKVPPFNINLNNPESLKRITRKGWCTLLLLLIVVSPFLVNAQPGNAGLKQISLLDDYLKSANESKKFNGVALVAIGDDIVFCKSFGWRNYNRQETLSTDTRFPILSITKSLTAMVIMKLQEEGRLSIQDKISKYFPEFKYGNKITIEHLLSHTSGLYNYTNNIDEADSALVNHPVSRQLVLDQFINKPLEFKPGSRYQYNNSGYYLLGLIIEQITGKRYEQVVREIIFLPLEMRHSGFDYNHLNEPIKATGYQVLNNNVHKTYTYLDSTVSYSAGGVYSTAADMFLWSGSVRNIQILSTATWHEMISVRKGNYALGFQVDQFQGKRYIAHSGGYPGFASQFLYYPDQKFTVILLSNVANYDQSVWPVAMGISSILHGLPYDNWKMRVPIDITESDLKQFEGLYRNGKYTIGILIEQGTLRLKHPSGALFELIPEGNNRFYLEHFNTQLEFESDNNGNVGKMKIHENGQDYLWIKRK